MNAIPDALKSAICAGIGVFIAVIGLVSAGIIVHPESGTILAFSSDVVSWNGAVFVLGLVAVSVLLVRGVPAALLIGIVAATAVAMVVNGLSSGTPVLGAVAPDAVAAMPDFGLVGSVSFGVFEAVGIGAAVALIVTVLMANFFDAMGTALAVGRRAKLTDADGRLPQMRRVLIVESAGAIVGGAASASSNTIVAESTAGAAQGGRTGLASVVTGALFLAAMFFAPLASVIPSAATGPALVVVGAMMVGQLRGIDWDDIGIAVPVFATVILMPLTYSIANGVGAGMVLYVLIAVGRGGWREIHPLMYAVAALFVWYFARGPM
jgi:AGZA family xanthine/uracil permease-like MFS transporter